jgi:hypothetical protein
MFMRLAIFYKLHDSNKILILFKRVLYFTRKWTTVHIHTNYNNIFI